MPIIVPPGTLVESLVLDDLDLAQGVNGGIQLDAFTPPIPKKRPEWITGSDSNGAILARDPLVDNGQALIRVAIAGAGRDDSQALVGSIIDKLEEAERNPAGIPLVWTPGDSTTSLTFYVLSGEVTEFPVDWESGYMAAHPMVTFTLDCKPYGYGDPVSYGPVTAAGPLVELELEDVPGDAPAEATLTVTEMSSQSRRTVEWGAEYLHYDPASPWDLILDSDDLVTTGFSGVQTNVVAGAYDPGASGNSIISATVETAAQAICGTGAQPHIGTFRVKARINSSFDGATNLYVRLAWRVGDGPYKANDPVLINTPVQAFYELDLGLITIPPASAGTQSWDGRVEAWTTTGSEGFYTDYLMLIPVEAGYGKATASYSYSPGVITGRDAFTTTTAGNNLNARVAPSGGTWATSGAATDFQFADPIAFTTLTSETISRSTTSDASGRYAILGTATPTDVEVQVDYQYDRLLSGTDEIRMGVIARWTDASNYLRAVAIRNLTAGTYTRTLEIRQIVAGVETVVASAPVASASFSTTVWQVLRLIAFSSGRVIASILDASATATLATVEGTSSALATGGTLASGKSGVYDAHTGTTVSVIRYYDNVSVATPATEPIALYSGRELEIRHDSAERESSAGGTWGRPQIYRGGRFYVGPAGDADRTTRVAVKASRNDLTSGEDANLTDQIKLEATVTPRYSVVPR